MSENDKNIDWLHRLIEADPGQGDWPALLGALGSGFTDLYPDDQVKAVEKLEAAKSDPAVPALVAVLMAKEGVSLPGLIGLMNLAGSLGLPVNRDHLATLTAWMALCDEDIGECDPLRFFELPDPLQRTVVDHLVQWVRSDLLTTLETAAPDREKKKAIRKALHRVRSAGAEVPGQAGKPAYAAPDREEYIDEAYLSAPDATGTFFVFIYRTIQGANTMIVLLVNDRDGVLNFEGFQVPLPKFRKILESTQKNPHAIVVKADPGHVRLLIRKAEETGRQRGKGQAEDYLARRRLLGITDEPEAPHPLWQHLDQNELQKERGLAIRSHELLEHRMFADWRLFPADEGKVVAELAELKLSPLALSPEQQAERKTRLFEKEAEKIVADHGRATWRDRLLECAYLLWLMAEPEPARMAAATGLRLESQDPPPAFFPELVRRTMKEQMEDEEKKDKRGLDLGRGGIVIA